MPVPGRVDRAVVVQQPTAAQPFDILVQAGVILRLGHQQKREAGGAHLFDERLLGVQTIGDDHRSQPGMVVTDALQGTVAGFYLGIIYNLTHSWVTCRLRHFVPRPGILEHDPLTPIAKVQTIHAATSSP